MENAMKSTKFVGFFVSVCILVFCLAFVEVNDEQQMPMIQQAPEDELPTGIDVRGGSRNWTLAMENYFPAATPKGVKARNFLLDLSHGAYFDFTPQQQFSSFISLLQSLGFNVTVASDFANIMNYDVVMSSLPQNYYSAADIVLLINYLNSDKIFILQGEWGDGTPWHNFAVNALLNGLTTGVQVQSSMVYEPIYYYIYNYWILIQNYTNHCLNDNVNTVIHPLPSHLAVNNLASVVYYSTNNAYLDTGGSGPFVISAVPDPAIHPNWKMFILGDTNPFSTYTDYDYINLYDNAQLATNVVFWCDYCMTNNECDDGDYCNGLETCNLTTHGCDAGTPPCADDGLFCNGTEGCDEVNDQCTSSGNPCPDDGLFCNGAEACNEASDQCTAGTNPCPDDGMFCNGSEECSEANDQCVAGTDPCPDDGQFCNGAEGCNEASDQCTAGANPCPDDALFCNGVETCDETGDACVAGTNPCPDDGLWCNGAEDCDEQGDQCIQTSTPCPDDGVFCNGTEGCNEATDQCSPGTDPCPDDSRYCTGEERCDEVKDECFSTGDPCVDDGLFCNGMEECDETTMDCISSGDPCPDDTLWCNGFESCNEDNDECDSTGLSCEDDGLFCNGEETCNETDDECAPGAPPCPEDETCNEETDTCDRGEDDDSDPDPSEDDDDSAPVEDENWPKGQVSGGCCGCD